MKPGVTLQQARADMDRVGAQLSQQFPETNRRHGVWVSALREEIAGPVQRGSEQNRSLRGGLLLLLGAVALVLLIACVNVANLLLARAADAARDGRAAGIWRGPVAIRGPALTESLVLGLLGGLGGLDRGLLGNSVAPSADARDADRDGPADISDSTCADHVHAGAVNRDGPTVRASGLHGTSRTRICTEC